MVSTLRSDIKAVLHAVARLQRRLRHDVVPHGAGEDCRETLSAIAALQKALSAEFDVGVSTRTLAPQSGGRVMQLQRQTRHLKETFASPRPLQ